MKKRKILIITLLIILGVAISTLIGFYVGNSSVRLWIDKNIFKKDIGEENLPVIEIDEVKNLSVCAYSNYVATVGNNTLTIYNQSAKVDTTISVSITTPEFFSCGKYLLIADKGNSNLYLLYNDTLQWQKTLDGNISKITVNENGAVGVSVSGTIYKSIVIMYDITGEETFKTYLSTTVATDLAISEDSKYLSFVEMNTAGTVIESKVKTISVDKAKNSPNESIIYTYTTNNNTLITKIKYKKDKLVAFTDSSINIYYNGNEEQLAEIDSNTKFADIDLDGYVCLVEENSDGLLSTKYIFKTINIESKKENEYTINYAIKSVYCNKNIIAANTGNEVNFINVNGWLAKKFTSIQSIKDISLGEHTAAIIYKNRVEIISL